MATRPNTPPIVIAGWNPDRVDRLFTRLYSDPSPVTIEGRKDLFKEIRALITGENDTYTKVIDTKLYKLNRQWAYNGHPAPDGVLIPLPAGGEGTQPATESVPTPPLPQPISRKINDSLFRIFLIIH